MKPDVLLVAPIHAPTRERLESDYTVHRLWDAKDRDAMLATLADRIEILVTSGGAVSYDDAVPVMTAARRPFLLTSLTRNIGCSIA